ncbi:hypothetical protein AFLA_013463 [Aspergillus flavus NRRL3357]|nr:hypothetical protein AFLA_013463 [Aspergillus flavus NRRL3357]
MRNSFQNFSRDLIFKLYHPLSFQPTLHRAVVLRIPPIPSLALCIVFFPAIQQLIDRSDSSIHTVLLFTVNQSIRRRAT